ncbi:MAG: hypothetical protein DRN96_08365 [Thermoproteota archaeon]|nr:MAG: hypothetical protein DRN96_08365 [Candidatus Korarchaeota archaeon]
MLGLQRGSQLKAYIWMLVLLVGAEMGFEECCRYVEVRGVRLYVYDSSARREYERRATLVFLHGLPGQLTNWKYQIPFFEREYRVVAYDQRGFGRSSKPKRVVFEDFTRDLEELLAELEVRDEDAVVVGHSFGGAVAQAYARDHGVKGLVLVGSLTRFRYDLLDYIMWYTPALIWKRLFFTMNPLTKRLYPKVFLSPASPIKVLEEFYEDNREYFRELPPSTYTYSRYFKGYDASSWLHQVAAPTLIVVGEDDVVTPLEESRRISELIPNSKLVVVEKAGHLILYEKPEELNATIMGFLKEIGA